MPGQTPNSSLILGPTASTIEPFGARSYSGGLSLVTARRMVVLEIPSFRAIARIGMPSDRCNRRISAQSSTLITIPPALTQRAKAAEGGPQSTCWNRHVWAVADNLRIDVTAASTTCPDYGWPCKPHRYTWS